MTVFENVAFGLRVRPRRQRPADVEIRRRVSELLALVQLDYLGDRHPSELSGGQRQRVALTRGSPWNRRCCCWTNRAGARCKSPAGTAAMAPAPARRDYDLELGRKRSADGLRVTVRDVRLYGAMVKVEVIDAEGGVIQVDLGRESFDRLQPTMSETLVVTPKRIRMFAPDPSP